jgi:hypothetical protein
VLALTVYTSSGGGALADLENGLVSVERVLEYSSVESEADPVIPGKLVY